MKLPPIGEQQGIRPFDDVDPTALPIILVGDAIVQRLADYPRIVLRDFVGKQGAARHLPHGEIANLRQHAVARQDQR